MEKKYLLGVDAGTTGCKSCIFDLEGNLLGSDYREYPLYHPHPGWTDQKAEDMVPALFATCKTAIAKAGVDSKDILAMSVSSQGASWGPLDKDGNLLRPFFCWPDQRGIDYVAKLNNGDYLDADEYYHICGHPIGPIFGVTKYLWFRDHEPELYEKTAHFGMHQDYFLRAFGVEDYVTDSATGCRSGMFDVANYAWSDKIIDAFGFEKEKFSRVVPAGTVVGKIPKHVAEQTGLKEGMPICVGAMDQDCSTLGAGMTQVGDAAAVIGTYGSIYVAMDAPNIDPQGIMCTKTNAGAKNWTMEAAAPTSASSYRWYRDTFAPLEMAMGKEMGVDTYEYINEQIASVPPGANGITFLPYLQGATGGARGDNPYARGCLLGMRLSTTRAEVARAVMEGITMEMRDNVETMRATNVAFQTVSLTGGATKSDMWNQMQADMYKIPVHIVQTSEAGCLGAALFAGVGVGVYANHVEAAKATVKVVKTYEPNPANFAAYDDAFKRFREAYESLTRGTYFALNK